MAIEDALVTGKPLQFAMVSGHGPGKSCVVSWIILWFMSTRWNLTDGEMAADTKVVVTANTKEQLNKKKWAELSKWHKLSINAHWFEYTATTLYKTGKDPKGQAHGSTWFASAVPWSKENTEAFAGTHGSNVLLIFDEASAVIDSIWEVADGAMTTKGAMWFCFGNPTRNTGRFAECFGKSKHRWHLTHVDSRTAKKVDQKWTQQILDDHGEDSDYARIRVLGKFPRAGSAQFIDHESVREAMNNELPLANYEHMPIVIGVDCARYGDDQTVYCVRQGKKIIKMETFRGIDLMQCAARTIEYINEYRPIATFIDGVGMGAGVVDRVQHFGYNIFDVNVGRTASDKRTYFNKRAEVWGKMKSWMVGADIPQGNSLEADLCGLEYSYTTTQQIKLESKKDMKSRGLASPDEGDAIALTFAEDVYGDFTEEDAGYPVDDYEIDSSTASSVTGY